MNGILYLDLKKTCRIQFFGGDGSLVLNGDLKATRYFAYLMMGDGGQAYASWNETPARPTRRLRSAMTSIGRVAAGLVSRRRSVRSGAEPMALSGFRALSVS